MYRILYILCLLPSISLTFVIYEHFSSFQVYMKPFRFPLIFTRETSEVKNLY